MSIYRYNLSPEIVSKILYFSKLHEFEERKDYVENWKLWCEENTLEIQEEEQRLLDLGYTGDVLNKMFKSSRYYFRKKTLIKVEPKQRGQYIYLYNDLLEKMDEYIMNNISFSIKPQDMYIQFCELNSQLIQESIVELIEKNNFQREDIDFKIKKTFKNRYFNITHK
jgi:hypothetical protein